MLGKTLVYVGIVWVGFSLAVGVLFSYLYGPAGVGVPKPPKFVSYANKQDNIKKPPTVATVKTKAVVLGTGGTTARTSVQVKK